jgi:hypothetical protein
MYILDYSANREQVLKFGLPHEELLDDDTSLYYPHPPPALENHDELLVSNDDGMESFKSHPNTPAASETQSAETAVEQSPEDETNELLFHLRMYLAGQMFGIQPLCDVAKDKSEKRLSRGPWKEEMVACIRVVYAHGSNLKADGLKEDIVKSARGRFRTLKTSVGWEDLLIDCPEFAAKMLNRL